MFNKICVAEKYNFAQKCLNRFGCFVFFVAENAYYSLHAVVCMLSRTTSPTEKRDFPIKIFYFHDLDSQRAEIKPVGISHQLQTGSSRYYDDRRYYRE